MLRRPALVASLWLLALTGGMPSPHVAQEASDGALSFELLPPCEGSSAEQLAEWTALVKTAFSNPGDPVAEHKARQKLLEVDVALITPAFINAVHGLDMSNPMDVSLTARLTDHWLMRQCYVAQFAFRSSQEAMSAEDIDHRVTLMDGWASWWRTKAVMPERVAEYREDVRTRWQEIGQGTYHVATPGR